MKTFEAPKMDVIKLDPKDIISTSGENDDTEPPATTNAGGSSCFPINLPPCGHGETGNQPAC